MEKLVDGRGRRLWARGSRKHERRHRVFLRVATMRCKSRHARRMWNRNEGLASSDERRCEGGCMPRSKVRRPWKRVRILIFGEALAITITRGACVASRACGGGPKARSVGQRDDHVPQARCRGNEGQTQKCLDVRFMKTWRDEGDRFDLRVREGTGLEKRAGEGEEAIHWKSPASRAWLTAVTSDSGKRSA